MQANSTSGSVVTDNKRTIRPIDVVLFLSLAFIGGDLLAFKAGGLTVRLVTFIILIGWFMMMCSHRHILIFPRTSLLSMGVMLVAMILSFPFSVDHVRTIAYIGWALFFFLAMVPLFYQYAKQVTPSKLITVWFLSFRLQTALLLAESFVRIVIDSPDRPHLWFYEPSYAAIYFSAYFGTSFYLSLNTNNKRWVDLWISIIACLLLASATAFYAVLITFLVCSILSKNPIKMLMIGSMSAFIVLSVLLIVFSDSESLRLLVGYLFEERANEKNLLLIVLERSGTRVVRLIWGWETFKSNLFFGIGFGADQTYTDINPVPSAAAEFLMPWDDVVGNPFTNPFVEAAATMGIPGLIAMALLFFVIINLYREAARFKSKDAQYVKAMATGLIIMFLVLQMEGTFLRYYFWAVFGMVTGAVSYLRKPLKAP